MNKHEALRILGLGRGACLEDARHAYREQVKLWHPDRYADSPALQTIAHKNIQDANRAWALLRPLLPKTAPRAPAAPAAVHRAAGVAPKERLEIRPAPRIMAGLRLRQRVRELAPLLARIRQVRIGRLTAWLRQDPNRDYRPWYRYSRTGTDAGHAGRPSFDQTLAKALESNGDGSLPPPAAPGRRPTASRSGGTVGKSRDQRPDADRLGAVEPVARSRKP